VLLYRSDGNDDGVVLLQEGFEFRISEFSEEYSGWFHDGATVSLRAAYGQRKPVDVVTDRSLPR
jgi:hypothetical protein